MTDNLVERLRARANALHGGSDYSDDMISAALLREAATALGAGEPGVKALDWRIRSSGDVREEAECILGLYRLALSNVTGKWRWSFNALDYPWSLELPTYEDAKAAAQADYERRIRSALASPPAPAVTEGMVDAAAKTASEWFYTTTGQPDHETWDEISRFDQNTYRSGCRAVLTAALSAPPAPGVDAGLSRCARRSLRTLS